MLFNIAFYLWMVALTVFCLPMLAMPRRFVRGAVQVWASGVMLLLRHIVGIDYVVRGQEHLPTSGPVVIASKHQSAWDTIIFVVLVGDPAYVLKQELFHLPLYGWFCRKMQMIGIDRSAGAAAIRGLIEDAKPALAAGRPLVIFPQGTRTAPCTRGPYMPGIYGLANQTGATVVPVALDSGRFWGRRAFVKRPGTITVEFLPPVPAGLSRRAFMADLEERTEIASDRLACCGQLAPETGELRG